MKTNSVRGYPFAVISLLALCAMLLAPCAPAAQREINESWKVEVGQAKKQAIKFFQAESVQLTETFTQNGSPVDLSATNLICVWEITGWDDYTNTYCVSTGVVASASNTVTFTLSPEQSNLTASNYYGFVRALQSVDTNLVQVAVLAYQTVAVEWSPAGQDYNVVSPLQVPEIYDYPAPASNLWFISSTARRTLNERWKTDSGQSQKQAIKFFQAESVQLNETFTQNGSPVDLTDSDTRFVWEITGWEDRTNVYALATGTATNGVLRFELTPEQSNLPQGNYYGFIRALRSDGTNLLQTAVLAWQTISVEWAPDSRRYHLVGPLTYPAVYDAATLNAISNDFFQAISGLQETKLDTSVFTQAVEQVSALLTQWSTNPPAAGPSGSLQYNRDGHLAGFTNLYFDSTVGKIAGGFGENVFRLYNGITNASDATESNLIFRLSNQAGTSQIEMGDDGDIGLLLRGDGYGKFSSIELGGMTRTDWQETDPVAMPAISNLTSGTDGFDEILLDSKISAWSDIGLTYTNAVRINNPVPITNNAAWTGWTTTGSLTAQNEILLLTGQYLLSPVQTNGVAGFEVNSYSAQNGTDQTIKLLSGTNEVAYPFYGQDAQFKIIAGDTVPGATAGLYVSGVTIVGYENLIEAATVKYVAGLRRTDAETQADDMTSKRYVDATQTAAEKHADSALAAYAADPSKTLTGDRLNLGNYTVIGSGAWRGVNYTQVTDTATIGTHFGDNIITLESGLTVVELQSVLLSGDTATLQLYAQNISGDPWIMAVTNLVSGTWTQVSASITDLGDGYYTATVDTTGFDPTGFFRAVANKLPASVGAVTINADLLNLAGHAITNVSEIVFTNGAKIVVSGNTLVFEAAP